MSVTEFHTRTSFTSIDMKVLGGHPAVGRKEDRPAHIKAFHPNIKLFRHDRQRVKILPVDNRLQQSFEPFFLIVYAGAQVRNNVERPAPVRAIYLQHLLLALQIAPLIMAGHAGISYRSPDRFFFCAEQFRAEFGQVITPMPARRMFGGYSTVRISST